MNKTSSIKKFEEKLKQMEVGLTRKVELIKIKEALEQEKNL
jgi:hypothetical protein